MLKEINRARRNIINVTYFVYYLFRFGICCVFVYSASGSTITQNCSYIRNPNYPNPLTDTSALSYTIQKCDPSKDIYIFAGNQVFGRKIFYLLAFTIIINMYVYFLGVCYLRLDFESFDINGLSASTENTMAAATTANAAATVVACQDMFTIQVNFDLKRFVINLYYPIVFLDNVGLCDLGFLLLESNNQDGLSYLDCNHGFLL